jgi:mannosyltransferase OCH1-like enzyme
MTSRGISPAISPNSNDDWPGQLSAIDETHDKSTYRLGFEEDDGLRSDFIRHLTIAQLDRRARRSSHSTIESEESIPPTLVRYWHDPDDLPPDVSECLATWEPLRRDGVSVHTFNDKSASRFIADRFTSLEVSAFERCRHPAMRSDYFRMCFLFAEGGLYVDADDVLLGDHWRSLFEGSKVKVEPLCFDIDRDGMLPAEDLAQRDLATENRIFYVNNDPIAAPPSHPLIERALIRSTRKLLGEDDRPEIQSTTGPGNFSAALAAHAHELEALGAQPDYELLLDWHLLAQPRWNLGYRADERNWRNMDR